MANNLHRLLRELEDLGLEVRTTKSGYQILTPGGGIVTVHRTESDHRALQNTKARLKREGVELGKPLPQVDNVVDIDGAWTLDHKLVHGMTVHQLDTALTSAGLDFKIKVRRK